MDKLPVPVFIGQSILFNCIENLKLYVIYLSYDFIIIYMQIHHYHHRHHHHLSSSSSISSASASSYIFLLLLGQERFDCEQWNRWDRWMFTQVKSESQYEYEH